MEDEPSSNQANRDLKAELNRLLVALNFNLTSSHNDGRDSRSKESKEKDSSMPASLFETIPEVSEDSISSSDGITNSNPDHHRSSSSNHYSNSDNLKAVEEDQQDDEHNNEDALLDENSTHSTRVSLISLTEEEADQASTEFLQKLGFPAKHATRRSRSRSPSVAQRSNLHRSNRNRNLNHQQRMSLTQRAQHAGSTAYRRVSRVSLAIAEASSDTLKAVPEQMEKYLDPAEVEPQDFDDILIGSFLSLQVMVFGVIVGVMNSFPTWTLTCPITVTSMCCMAALTKTMHATTRGERIVTIVGLTILLVMTSLCLMVVTTSCTHCIYHWAENAMASSQDFAAMDNTNANHRSLSGQWGVAWDLLLTKDDDLDQPAKGALTGACRKCVSSIFVVFIDDWKWKPWYWLSSFWNNDKTGSHKTKEESSIEDGEDEAVFKFEPYQNADSMYGDLASWYLHYANKTVTSNLKVFNQKFAKALSVDGHFTDEEITDVMQEFLCSPASRVDNPDPGKFLKDLKTPRFTGEKGLNISTAALQGVLRGDKLKELGAALCFILRFSLFVPEDFDLDRKSISYTQLYPSMNEQGMKSKDYTSTLPFMVLPGFDQDIDIHGTNMKTVDNLVDIFTRFPFNDVPIYFDTKEEYYAFYRWEMENTLQDDWYFPQWFLQTEKASDLAELMAQKLQYAHVDIAFEDAYSDRSLGDRTFFGPSAKFLTPIKIPGVDDDYEYMWPGGPDTYMTEEHTEEFRCTAKPKSAQLLDMIYKFWPKEAVRGQRQERRGENVVPLARFKNRVLEIDMAVFHNLESREGYLSTGCILYLDPKTRLPMGIYSSSRTRMYLPTDKDWPGAKFFYMVTERITVATYHVIESHLIWSQPFATAAWQTLPENHGLRILTKPFTLNAHSVNWAAHHLLARNHSILHHASGKSHEGYIDLMMTVFKDFNFSRSVPKYLAETKLDKVMNTKKVPFHEQGLRLWDAHREFVENFINLLYPTDHDLLQDDAAVRFWHHANTYGRQLDPCVCGLDSDLFFDEKAWPGFETTHTCGELLDLVSFKPAVHAVTRRRDWCTDEVPFARVKAMRKLLEKDCERNPTCSHLPYNIYLMKADMGLPALETKDQFIDYITTVVWHVTAGHQVNSDNIPYFPDPDLTGVRMRTWGPGGEGEPMERMDLGAYILGNTISSLTSLRAPALLADWTPLYSHYATKQHHLSGEERKLLFESLNEIHKSYKFKLLDLSTEMLAENLKRPLSHRWHAMNPATHASSVSV